VGAPELARLGRARLKRAGVALLGTLCRDGSPRISPVDVHLAEDHLLVGAVAGSAKTGDLRRDPRYVLHSVVTGPDSGEGEFKLTGSVAEAGPSLRAAATGAWWLASAPEDSVVFVLHVARAVFVDWDVTPGLMTVHRWSPGGGYTVVSRAHP
jgi:hypothetical protein